MNWFYENNGASAGPVEDAALQELIANGTVTAVTKVWHEGMPGWEAAATVLPDAFPNAEPAPSAAPAPQAPAGYPQQQAYAPQAAYAPAPAPKPLPVPASTIAPAWKRCVAFALDYMVLFVPFGLMGLSASVGALSYRDAFGSSVGSSVYAFFVSLINMCWQILFTWIYLAAFQASRFQATPGMMLMNLKVVNAEGGRMTFANATGRAFGTMLSGLILGIGFLLGLFNPARQCLHDTLAKTYVTDNEAPTEG